MQNRGKEISEQERRIDAWMAKIKHKIVVLSGKGGVGKSTVAANLAVALARKGRPNMVGILDADITGPSVPKMLGARKQQLRVGPPGIFPAIGPLGIKIISMDFLLQSDETPIIWRGPLKSVAIKQFLADVVWGELEFLLIDLPPGTGDEALSIMQLIADIDGVIIITIPSEVSQIVVKKAVTFTRKLNSPIIGIIENMSGFVCPKCGAETNIFKVDGGQKISDDLDVPFLGKIPLDSRICEGSDQGSPFIIEHPDSPAAKAFVEIVGKIEDFLKKGEKRLTPD
ncbi:MAG: Mrp/NBP35 family ATP-binding protein [Candidatus Methylarchaceae archaeon HK01M]|nr:Mrp/NBP35 family ATP-binding protein [Candidatus Methylarchaceae archaeon HK01M]